MVVARLAEVGLHRMAVAANHLALLQARSKSVAGRDEPVSLHHSASSCHYTHLATSDASGKRRRPNTLRYEDGMCLGVLCPHGIEQVFGQLSAFFYCLLIRTTVYQASVSRAITERLACSTHVMWMCMGSSDSRWV